MNTTQVTSTGIAVTLAVVVALALLFFGPHLFSPFSPSTSQTASTTPVDLASTTNQTQTMDQSLNQSINPAPLPTQLPTELSGQDVVVGTGATATAGHQVTVNYVGMLPDGTVFDASAKHGQPFTFALGAGQVIKGWDTGVVGMKVGGKRRLIVPPAYGYGSQAVGPIPANSTLIFDVELLDVK